MIIQDAYNLIVTTSDSQGTPRTISPQTFQGGFFNSYNIVLKQDQLAEADLLISFYSRQFIQSTLDSRRLQVVTLNTLLADIKDGEIVYLLQLEDSFFIPVVNIIEDLLLLVASTYIDPLDVEIPVINIVEDLLFLAASTYRDPLVPAQITYTLGGGDRNPKTIKYTIVELYILLVRVYLRNVYQPHPSLYWLPEALYYIIVALTSVASSLLDIYKEEINIFSNKLVNTLLQSSKYNYTINLEEGKTLPQIPLYNLLQKELQIL